MKKLLHRAMIILMVIVMALSTASCVGSGNNNANSGDTKGNLPEGLGDLDAELAEALMNSGKIQVYCWGAVDDYSKLIFEEFATKYGGEVEPRIINWDRWEDTFITHYAGNSAPDLIYVFEKLWPKVGNRGMLYSTKELKEKGVLGLDHFLITENEDVTKKQFSYKGEQYAFTYKTIDPGFIFVKEDVFSEHEVKSPSAYYSEGLWNWDTFLKCCREITKDWDGDGDVERYGYYGWDSDYFVLANGGQLISMGDDGTLTNTMDSLNVKNALDFVRNLYSVEHVATSVRGKGPDMAAMIGYLVTNICNDNVPNYTGEWSMVPFPTGPDATTTVCPGIIDGWGCVSSSQNPQGVVNYIMCMKMYNKEHNCGENYENWLKYFSDKKYDNGKTFLETAEQYRQFTVAPIYQGVGGLYQSQWGFWNTVRGTSQTTQEIISSFRGMFDAQIEAENNAAVK